MHYTDMVFRTQPPRLQSPWFRGGGTTEAALPAADAPPHGARAWQACIHPSNAGEVAAMLAPHGVRVAGGSIGAPECGNYDLCAPAPVPPSQPRGPGHCAGFGEKVDSGVFLHRLGKMSIRVALSNVLTLR